MGICESINNTDMSTFENLGLQEPICRALHAIGYENPTPIQAQTIPQILSSGSDLKAFAQTGTGKTAAFSLPILEHLDTIFTRIWEHNPETEIVYIAAKPSPLRWELRKEYEALNKAIERRAKKEDRLVFADVYSPMLEKGQVRTDLFVEDRLHMNRKGYAIWAEIIRPLVME